MYVEALFTSTVPTIGGVKGGKRCRFYASDRDVNYETADGIAE
jgi:hypothetical protein